MKETPLHKNPFERSYWVIPGRFLAGYYPGNRSRDLMEQEVRNLLDCGIRSIINLMEADELYDRGVPFLDYTPVVEKLANGSSSVLCHRMPIRDVDVPKRHQMVEILDLIDASLNDNQPVYVHCWGGRGRTGTVMGCWLIRHNMAAREKAIEMIRQFRRFEPTADWPSPEAPSQVRMVLSWGKGE
jgi:protein tyrosine/serine phosphatase